MLFSEMKLRADNIGGEIKQADADVKEAQLVRERAEKALEVAKEFETRAISRASEKRKERDRLALDMAEYIRAQGERAETGANSDAVTVPPGMMIAAKGQIFNDPDKEKQ